MAFSLIANTAAVSSTSAIDTTGATLIVIGASYDSAATVSDNKGNTYTAALTNTAYNTDMAIYYCVNPVVGSGHTFTISLSYCTICVAAFSGVKVSPVDQTSSGGTNSATSVASGSITPLRENTLVISMLAAGGTSTGYSENSTLSVLNSINAVNGVSFGAAMAYEIQTSDTAQNVTWSWTNASPCTAGIVSFMALPEIKKINGVYMGSQEIASTALAGDANKVAYYKMEAGALTTDSSGNGYTLTNNNTVADGTGKFGGAANFGNPNSNKSLTRADNLGIAGTSDMTVSMWVKVAAQPAASAFIGFYNHFSTTTADRYHRTYYYNAAGVLSIRMESSGGTNIVANYTLTNDVWYHLVFVRAAATLIYANGVQIGSGTTGTLGGGGQNRFGIGEYTASDYFTGLIDDVYVASRALTSDEIYSLYKTGVKKLNGQVNLNPEFSTTSLASDANLRAYWKLEDVNDETANNYDLTNVGTVAFNAGKFSNCADTGASNSTKKLTVASNLGIAGGNCSINIWFNAYAATFAGDHPPLISVFSDQTGGAGVAYGLGINTTGLFAFRLKSGVAWQETAATAILASSWYMATMTYDGTNCKLYINGVYISQVAASGNGSTGFYPDKTALFCHAGYTTDAFTSAKIDDADVFDDVLTATEISNLYNTNIKKYMGISNV